MAIAISCATFTSRSRCWASISWSWVRSQATRGMSGLSARVVLLAARTASSAGTVIVGSATEAVARWPVPDEPFVWARPARAARAVAIRDDPRRARAVAPVAPAALVRRLAAAAASAVPALASSSAGPALAGPDARAGRPVAPPDRVVFARPAALPPLLVVWRFDPLVLATVTSSSPTVRHACRRRHLPEVYPQVDAP